MVLPAQIDRHVVGVGEDARTVYIRLLTETLGAHLDDAALDDVAAAMAKLRASLAEAAGGSYARW